MWLHWFIRQVPGFCRHFYLGLSEIHNANSELRGIEECTIYGYALNMEAKPQISCTAQAAGQDLWREGWAQSNICCQSLGFCPNPSQSRLCFPQPRWFDTLCSILTGWSPHGVLWRSVYVVSEPYRVFRALLRLRGRLHLYVALDIMIEGSPEISSISKLHCMRALLAIMVLFPSVRIFMAILVRTCARAAILYASCSCSTKLWKPTRRETHFFVSFRDMV